MEINGKSLSGLYKILLSMVSVCNRTKGHWELDLGAIFTDTQWHKIQEFNLLFSADVAIKENRFKLINQWYLTPEKLAKMFPQADQCW